MERPCANCGASPTETRFYSSIRKWCATCWAAMVRTNRAERLEQYREFEAMRYARDYEKRRALMTSYAQTERGREAARRNRAKWEAMNPHKRAAQKLVRRAMLRGELIRPATCQVCGAGGRIHGHHDDYSKPLDVRWLCTACHAEAHHGERAIAAKRRQSQEAER